MSVIAVNLADLRAPNGRTYRENNRDQQHAYPVGALVEETETGVRMFVAVHARDCDQTPLYTLTPDPDATNEFRPLARGYPEGALALVSPR